MQDAILFEVGQERFLYERVVVSVVQSSRSCKEVEVAFAATVCLPRARCRLKGRAIRILRLWQNVSIVRIEARRTPLPLGGCTAFETVIAFISWA